MGGVLYITGWGLIITFIVIGLYFVSRPAFWIIGLGILHSHVF